MSRSSYNNLSDWVSAMKQNLDVSGGLFRGYIALCDDADYEQYDIHQATGYEWDSYGQIVMDYNLSLEDDANLAVFQFHKGRFWECNMYPGNWDKAFEALSEFFKITKIGDTWDGDNSAIMRVEF
jgi:hypothetical protein